MIVDELIKNTDKAALILHKIKDRTKDKLTVEDLLPSLRQVVYLKLMTTDNSAS